MEQPSSVAADDTRIEMGEILRDARPKAADPLWIDGHRNLYAVTSAEGAPLIRFDSGINWNAAVKAPEGLRLPAIIIASSPHKAGRAETPWEDTFDSDRGYIRYYGDNKTPGADPALERGNRVLLDQYALHASKSIEERRRATPLVFFRRMVVGGTPKGYPQFHGFGIIRRAELVVQLNSSGKSFSNYVFEFLVFTLGPEQERFDWQWINQRRDLTKTLDETNAAAPLAWRDWVKKGDAAIGRVRRDVQRGRVRKKDDQLPPKGSRGRRLLEQIHHHYKGKQVRFEAVAAWVTERRLEAGGIYRHHGVTRASGDRGFDFIGSLELGKGFGSVRLVVLGQAKCEEPTTPTNAVHVARTVARLRRGWVGSYVTTSYFSQSTQEEILEDKYPLLLIDGRTVAEEVQTFMLERRIGLDAALEEIESRYGELTEVTNPEQLTFSGWPVGPDGSAK